MVFLGSPNFCKEVKIDHFLLPSIAICAIAPLWAEPSIVILGFDTFDTIV